MPRPRPALTGALGRGTDLILPIGLVASILVIVVPMPAALMDVLLSVNLAVAVVMLLTTIYVRTPLEFSIFPTLLLATTLGRLVLNVATTRLILTRGESHGLLAAGEVVRAFGEFVAGDKIAVGLIIFAIIVIIQFVVITKGSTRISEVAARFALDSMPGKQMAIDADLNAGAIDEKEAQRRRQEVARSADFFGAMDGASKFIRGDAVAGIIITLVNIIGGLFIGLTEAGMSLSQAGEIYTKLTIGDGLVSQVPAFLISVAAGLLVTRSNTATNLPSEFLKQLFSRPQALLVTAGFVGLLVFTSLPAVPLVIIAGSCIALAMMLTRREKETQVAEAARQQAEKQKPPVERIEDYLAVDPLEIELGIGLLRLADPQRGGDLLARVQRVRQSCASDLGIIMPKVRIRDNTRLDQRAYRIKVTDLPVAEGKIYANRLLAVETVHTSGHVAGIEARHPVTHAAAVWIEPNERGRAELLGYTVTEPMNVIVAHLTETVRRNADEILTRDATKHLIDELKKTSPAVVDELIPSQLKLSEVQQILQLLLREQVPVRPLAPILETLGDYAARTRDPVLLTELVRQRLARTLCTRYRDSDRRLHVVTLDPAIEDRIRAGFEHTDQGLFIRMSPRAIDTLCRQIASETELLTRAGHPAVLLVSPPIRAALKQMTAPHLPHLAVLCFNEITRDTQIESVGLVAEAAEDTKGLRVERSKSLIA